MTVRGTARVGNYAPAQYVYLPHDQKHPRMMKVCVECGIESLQKVSSKGFCSRSCAQKGMNNSSYKDDVGYQGVHGRLLSQRGSASEYDCVDCGGTAREWAWNHKNNAAIAGDMGFSYDVSDYDPRCALCHREFDR